MSRDEQDVHPYLRRAVDTGIQKNYCHSDYQRLLWTLVYYEKAYPKNELAAHIGVSVDTLHAYANGDLRLHSDTIKKINEFCLAHDPHNRKLANHHLPRGWVAVPADIYGVLGDIINVSLDLQAKLKKAKADAEREE